MLLCVCGSVNLRVSVVLCEMLAFMGYDVRRPPMQQPPQSTLAHPTHEKLICISSLSLPRR
uniref:Uncharacterized protein n=1 Tax=Arion vulgaris TaxID=1028688 RepID=A0A0B7A0T9_9EUPU